MKNSIFSYFQRIFLDSKGCVSTSLVNKISKVTIPGKVLLTEHKALQLKKYIYYNKQLLLVQEPVNTCLL